MGLRMTYSYVAFCTFMQLYPQNYIQIPYVRQTVINLKINHAYQDLGHMSAAALANNMKAQMGESTYATVKAIIEKRTSQLDRKTLVRKFQKELPPYSFPTSEAILKVFNNNL